MIAWTRSRQPSFIKMFPDVGLDGGFAEEELSGDFPVGRAAGYPDEDLGLPRGEVGQRGTRTPDPRKALRQLDPSTRKDILAVIRALGTDPRPAGVKSLKGHRP